LDLQITEIEALLNSIGLATRHIGDCNGKMISVTVSTGRPDLEREIDLIEEVARLNGYDRIPVTMPTSRMICHRPPEQKRLVRRLQEAMVAGGFSEVVNYSFVSPLACDSIGLASDDFRRENVRILNPLTEEQSVMRTSLVSSMLDTVSRNNAYRSLDLRLFELRPVYLPQAGEILPQEGIRLCAAVCGRREPEGWAQQTGPVDFFDLKGIAEELFEAFNVCHVTWDNSSSEPFLHPGKSCTLRHKKGLLGTLGEVHPGILAKYDIDQPVFLLDLDLTVFFEAIAEKGGFKPISRFPDVYRDSALLVEEAVQVSQVFDFIEKEKSPIVESYALFDLYKGQGIPVGKKSLAIRVRYRSAEKTLTEEEISLVHDRIVKALQKELGAEIR
jgi:phenylalanyl-tRNA synthetase beta chain